jgi:hypothetical protein
MTELREDTEHAANGQFATKGGGDGLIGKSLGAKHDVLRTPEVHAQMAKMYKQAAPTMLKGTSLHQEYSFTVDKKSGKPSKIESSDESNKNHFVKPDDPVTAIVHTHPDGTLPTPGPGDPLAAVLVDAPNYELSQKELWVVQPDGTQEQVGTVEWKHGDIVITPMSGERSLPFNYSDNPNPKQPVPDSSVASGTDRSKEHERSHDKEHKHSLWKEIQKFFRVPDDPDLDPDDNVDPDDPDDEALRENIMELFCDARSQGKTIPQEEWKRLGIGYGPVGGQQFPEACSMELMKLGPQGEPIERCIACLCGECQTHDSEFRYSEDQPREPNGEFGSGGASNESKEEHIASVVKDQVKKMVGDKDPAIINGGNCVVFAKAMEKQIPDANRVGIPNVALYGDSREHTIAGATPGSPRITVSIDKTVNAKDMPKRISSYLHQWVQVNGKNYDSETPNGVKNWRDLPFFKKGGPGRENLDNAAKHMTRSLDALQEERGLGDSLAVGGGDSQKLGAADQFKAGQLRYSPDQPRDPDGKFASGGSGGRVR